MRRHFLRAPSAELAHNYHPSYRPDIDGLRAIAILSVLLFHAQPSLVPGGFVGVDIFFVISGFLISNIIFKSLADGKFRFTEFYAHRIRRIFPALLLVLFATYVFGWFSLLPDEYKQLGKHIAASASFIQNFVLWQESGYFDTATELKPLMHIWSLGIEEQFYLAYPLLIWLAWRTGFSILTLVILIGLISFGLNIGNVDHDPIGTFFLPQNRLWELLVGGLLAYIQIFAQGHYVDILRRRVFSSHTPPKYGGIPLQDLLASLGLLLIALSLWLLNQKLAFPGWWAFIPVIGSALMIISGPEAWINRHILAHRSMVLVGLISYPLYLWHWPLLSYARILEGGEPSNIVRSSLVALSFMLAWLTYRFIERPIRTGPKTWFRSLLLCGLMLILTYAGYNAYERDGIARRQKHLSSQMEQFDWLLAKTTDNCLKATGLPEKSFCLRSEEKSQDVVLIGDSHANSLFPGLASAYGTIGRSVWNLGGGGCIPFFDTASYQFGMQEDGITCKDAINRAYDFAMSHPSVKTIVLSARWPIYLSGEVFDKAHELEKPFKLQWDSVPPTTPQAEIFARSLEHTLTRLSESGKKIILVMDWAELGFNPKTCFDFSGLRHASKRRNQCAIPRHVVEARQHAYRELLERTLAHFHQVMVFDPLPYICDAEWCYVIRDGKTLYRDDDHLSLFGSEFIAHMLVTVQD